MRLNIASFLTSAFLCFVLLSSCGNKCKDPNIIVTKEMSPNASYTIPGTPIFLHIEVMSDDNIKSVEAIRVYSGSEKQIYFNDSYSSGSAEIDLTDSVPVQPVKSNIVTYRVTVTTVCKTNGKDKSKTNILEIPVGDSISIIKDSVGNSYEPSISTRFVNKQLSAITNIAWDLLGVSGIPLLNPTGNMDIYDTSLTATPYVFGNVRWTSKTNSLFVKTTSLNWDSVSQKSIIDAYKSGTPASIIMPNKGDMYVIRIRNSEKYALIKIKEIYPDNAISVGTYFMHHTYFSYKLVP